eukprot:TRINITY_DN3919_c0_g1_i2.p1 TRINITY_DN3919_c0_g1~~TRINITY_DN3919_c0_g1_i2.p1  ORF type:complete len:251 (-),score=51.48 TRINITY_DN3919_c0_g1_i2:186-938(-)
MCIRDRYQRRVRDEKLRSWSAHSSLGKAIFEITQSFAKDPPVVAPTRAQSQGALHHKPQRGMMLQHAQSEAALSSWKPGSANSAVPVIPSHFPELEALSPQQVTALLSNENEFRAFFSNLSSVKNMEQARQAHRKQAEAIARQNLGYEQQLNALKMETAALQRSVTEKRTQFDQKARRQQQVMSQYTTESLIDSLSKAAAQAEQEAEAIAQQFTNRQLTSRDFIRLFMEKKKLHHLRSAKREYLLHSAKK